MSRDIDDSACTTRYLTTSKRGVVPGDIGATMYQYYDTHRTVLGLFYHGFAPADIGATMYQYYDAHRTL
eukprot:3100682-Rhodomonas_salina.1